MKWLFGLLLLCGSAAWGASGLKFEESPKAIRNGETILKMDVALEKTEFNAGFPMQISIVYSNRTAEGIELEAPFQFGRYFPGVSVEIFDDKSNILSYAGDRGGSTRRYKIGPGKTLEGTLTITVPRLPKETGTYAVQVVFHYGHTFSDGHYLRTLVVKSPMHPITVKAGKLPQPSFPVVPPGDEPYCEWKALLAATDKNEKVFLLSQKAKDNDSSVSRAVILRTLCDTNVPVSTRLLIPTALTGVNLPYDANLLTTIASTNENRELRMAMVGLLPRVFGPVGRSGEDILKELWKRKVASDDWPFRYAIIKAMKQTGAMQPPEMLEVASNEPDAHAKYLLALLMFRSDYTVCLQILDQIKDRDRLLDQKLLLGEMNVKKSMTMGEAVDNTKKLIELLKKEASEGAK